MLKIIFYLKAGKVNKKGESLIFARITHNQKSTTMATGKSILKERWQFTNNLRNVLKIEKEKVIKHSLMSVDEFCKFIKKQETAFGQPQNKHMK